DEDEVTKTKERIGINTSDCGIIEAEIKGSDVEVLACRIQAASKLYPESKLPESSRYLKDFKWRGEEKMLRWQDIFDNPPEYLEVQIKENSTESGEMERVDLDELINQESDQIISEELVPKDSIQEPNQNSENPAKENEE